MHQEIQSEAPGSMMLFGEHAVLHGYPALVCAIDRRIRVRLEPRSDRQLWIRSSLGNYAGTLEHLPPDARFRFALAAVKTLLPDLPGGCAMTIDSDFPGAIGLGTSAAVTVAVLSALSAWAGASLPRERLLESARTVIRQVQGRGSGADAAASVFGGIVAFRTHPGSLSEKCRAEPLGLVHPITVAYAGYKTPTADVIDRVTASGRQQPDLQTALFEAIGKTAATAETDLRAGTVDRIGEWMNIGHGLLEALGVCDARLSELAYRLRALPEVTGAKISGSGLGDCVIGWGRPSSFPEGREWIPVSMTTQGVQGGYA